MTSQHRKAEGAPRIQVGQPFNPYKLFKGIFIPEPLVRSRDISAGAKLIYGRLARYAGKDGKCWPAVATLAAEIGLGARQTRKYLAELERKGLTRRISRFKGGAQISNTFEFLGHPLFKAGVNDRSGERVNDDSLKEGHCEDSHFKEDLDCPLTNRKNRDSRPAPIMPPSRCKSYPRLRVAMADYMMEDPQDEKIFPSERHVVDVMNAAHGATEDEVIRCLGYLREERGLKPGTRNGPRSFQWFRTVIDGHFRSQRERQESANPMQGCEARDPSAWRLSDEEFQEITAAIE